MPVAAGKATARAISGARLMLLEGVGHTLPRGTWPRIVDAVSAMTASAEARAG